MNGKSKKLYIIRGRAMGPVVIFNPNDAAAVLQVCFNPTEYSIEKQSVFAEGAIPGLDSPIIQYSRGNVRTLTMEILLDTYTYGNSKDLREKYINKLESLRAIDGELHAQPPCKIVWGSLEFVGVLESLRKNYTFFLDDGTPVRARVNMTWKEYVPVELQLLALPRSSPDRRKTRVLQEGDTLWGIAYEAYGNPGCWKILAEANDIDNPVKIIPGREILIPPLEMGQGEQRDDRNR